MRARPQLFGMSQVLRSVLCQMEPNLLSSGVGPGTQLVERPPLDPGRKATLLASAKKK